MRAEIAKRNGGFGIAVAMVMIRTAMVVMVCMIRRVGGMAVRRMIAMEVMRPGMHQRARLGHDQADRGEQGG